MTAEVALVVGGGSGIGRATSEGLARRGAHVVVADKVGTAADRVSRGINAEGHRSTPMAFDASDVSQVTESVARIHRDFGRIDVLVNAAGIARATPTFDVSVDEWNEVLQVNLSATFFACQAVGRIMAAQSAGCIVNVASLAGLSGSPQMAHYTASKHAVVGLTKALAVEWAQRGIRVNCVCPGATDTPLLTSVVDASYFAETARIIPMGRLATAAEQAAAIMFLCSSEARYVTGAVLCVDGGVSAMSATARERPSR